MKSKTSLFFVLLVFVISGLFASEKGPIAVSPGSDMGIAVVGEYCPTFSWTSVEWASGYRIEVFESVSKELLPYEQMAAMAYPILSKEIQGRALSWTPSTEEQLNNGITYVWYIQAMDAYGTAMWSGGRAFAVQVEYRLIGFIEKVAEALKVNGITDDVINKVLADMSPLTDEDTIDPPGTKISGYKTQDKLGIQGNETGSNTWYGENAGSSLTSGTNNSFFGKEAGKNVTEGGNNVFVGSEAGEYHISGSGNVYVGSYAGGSAEGSGNVYIGRMSARQLEGGSNTIVGFGAGYDSTLGNDNTFLGHSAGRSNAVSNNTFIGSYSGYTNTTGDKNTFLGHKAGEANESGINNTFIGYQTGLNNTASHNTFLGRSTGELNTTGHSNTFLGHSAGYSNSTGQGGTYVGRAAGFFNDADNNTFIGHFAGYNNSTGAGNVFIGHNVGYNETGSNKLYIDNSNTSSPLIFGDFSSDVVAINGKLGVGTQSPSYDLEVETTGKNAIFGLDRTDGARTVLASRSNMGGLGTLTNHPLLLAVNASWKMKLNTDNSLSMSNGATCTAVGVWTNASSRAYKENIHDLTITEAKDALTELNPVKYNYKKDKEEEYVGFIAEDVPDLVASKDRKGMSPMDVVAVLTKVVQDQQDTITELQERIDKLEKKS